MASVFCSFLYNVLVRGLLRAANFQATWRVSIERSVWVPRLPEQHFPFDSQETICFIFRTTSPATQHPLRPVNDGLRGHDDTASRRRRTTKTDRFQPSSGNSPWHPEPLISITSPRWELLPRLHITPFSSLLVSLPCSIFWTEEDEDAVDHAGRRPARLPADEDDEVKKISRRAFGAALIDPPEPPLHVRGHSNASPFHLSHESVKTCQRAPC